MTGAHRPEDRYSRAMWDVFPDGATLAELEEFFRLLRERAAPGDAHPEARLNEHHEVVGIRCTVQRHPEMIEIWERNRRP